MKKIQIEQTKETGLIEESIGPFKIRYAYARARDAKIENLEGEDYLTLQIEPQRMVFALCDGVGQSFLGGLAAQFLGESLIRWLWGLSLMDHDAKRGDSQLGEFLSGYLNSETERATQIILGQNISDVESEIVREVMDRQRERYGSQSNFVCGRIDARTSQLPQGRVMLFWLGDAKLKTWIRGKENTEELLNPSWNSREKWSSKHGVLGKIHYFQGDVQALDNIIAFSDGFDFFRENLKPKMDKEFLKDLISSLSKLAESDDISYVEIVISKELIQPEAVLEKLRSTQPDQEHYEEKERVIEEIAGSADSGVDRRVGKNRAVNTVTQSGQRPDKRRKSYMGILILFLIIIILTILLLAVVLYRSEFDLSSLNLHLATSTTAMEATQIPGINLPLISISIPSQLAPFLSTNIPIFTPLP